jgi:hypothetical protein
MSVRLDGEIIRLEGRCYIEDVEPLVVLLHEKPGGIVDCSAAETLHTAIIQVLLAFTPGITGECGDEFVRRWVVPFITKERDLS